MLDKNLILNQPDLVKKALENKGLKTDVVDKILEVDQGRRGLQLQVDDKRSEQNKISRNIQGKPTEDQIAQAKDIKDVLQKLEDQLKFVDEELFGLLEQIPNLSSEDTPVGHDDSANVVIKTVGEIPKYDFPVRDHVELGKLCDIIDTEKASKLSGSRFGYYKNKGAQLELTLMWWVFMRLANKGFKAMIPPFMIKHQTEWAMGYVSNQNLSGTYYYMPEDDLTFISSSEHSVGPYHSDETLNIKDLPIKYVNFSPCFRREAGTYGKDMKGMFRLHCFNKVEMIALTAPDFAVSDAMCEELLAEEEAILQDLGLPYQVLKVCTGDMPFPNRRQYDINTWFPGQSTYRETSSCSNCSDYQTRRLKTKVSKDGKSEYAHMLNATAVVDRVVIAILENSQQKDGSILMPKVLQPLLGFDIIKPKL